MLQDNLKYSVEFLDHIESLGVPSSTGPLHYLRAVLEAASGPLLPFPLTARVRLVVTPNYDENHGWRGAQHFLVAGCEGTVEDIGLDSNGYRVGFVPDNQTWVSPMDGSIKPVTRPAMYYFRPEHLAELPKGVSDADVIGKELTERVATLYVRGKPDGRIDIWEKEGGGFRVIKSIPYPPPTRGTEILSADVRSRANAFRLADLWEEKASDGR